MSELVDSWELALRAERKSAETLRSYLAGVRLYFEWCAREGLPDEIAKRAVQAWIAEMLDQGAEAATGQARLLAVRRFAAWLAEEDEIPADPLLGIKGPKIDTKVTQPLSDDDIRAMLAACGKDFMGLRDAALLRLMTEAGVRAGEVVAMEVADLNLREGVAVVRRGKGGKGRVVPVRPQTAAAIDKYLRARRSHRLADSPRLWLGEGGKGLSYPGLWKALKRRADAAKVEGFHPHALRHTAAHRWLAAGGSEGGLMAIAGWERPEMLLRYSKARAADRAFEEAKKLGLGDL